MIGLKLAFLRFDAEFTSRLILSRESDEIAIVNRINNRKLYFREFEKLEESVCKSLELGSRIISLLD